MPVSRCPLCHRGLAGYLYGEKDLSDLTPIEVVTEIARLQAKEARIREYMEDVRLGIREPQMYPDGTVCNGCQLGWREFQERRKDLEQLRLDEARSALASNTRWLKALRERRTPVGPLIG
jgi:hypothetical protein